MTPPITPIGQWATINLPAGPTCPTCSRPLPPPADPARGGNWSLGWTPPAVPTRERAETLERYALMPAMAHTCAFMLLTRSGEWLRRADVLALFASAPPAVQPEPKETR